MNSPAVSDLLNDDPQFPEAEDGLRRRLDYLGYAPCPVRSEMRRRMHAVFSASAVAGCVPPVWYVAAGCHSANPYDELWRETTADFFPSLISEVGFGDYTRPEFIRRWLEGSNLFAPVPAPAVRPEYRDAGLVDPRGIFHVYAVNAEVMLVDHTKLGDRPMPQSWSDLLHERFRGEVVISGEEGDIHETKLYAFHRMFGEAGLEALGANVRDFMHPAEMAKSAGAGNPKGATIYVLPWFFARSNPHREKTAIVWPREGALAGLLYLLRRREPTPGSKLPLAFLVGSDWTAHLAKVGFPPSAGGSALPGPLVWAGWDYVYSHDLEAIRPSLNAAFVRGRRR